ncbi:MAG: hypothetical protein QME21_18850 [Anaerolineales bacterium]|nr:hypothetical protein [Anaerolineales bacterium]
MLTADDIYKLILSIDQRMQRLESSNGFADPSASHLLWLKRKLIDWLPMDDSEVNELRRAVRESSLSPEDKDYLDQWSGWY